MISKFDFTKTLTIKITRVNLIIYLECKEQNLDIIKIHESKTVVIN